MRASTPVLPMTPDFNLQPTRDKRLLRRQLQAERMALHDALTGLPNRTLVLD